MERYLENVGTMSSIGSVLVSQSRLVGYFSQKFSSECNVTVGPVATLTITDEPNTYGEIKTKKTS